MKKLLVIIFAIFAQNVWSQTMQENYKNADEYIKKYSDLFYGGNVAPKWYSDTEFWYSEYTPKGTFYYSVNAQNLKKNSLFDAQKVSKLVSSELDKEFDIEQNKLSKFNFNSKKSLISFVVEGYDFRISTNDYTLVSKTKLKKSKPEPIKFWREYTHKSSKTVLSPDAKSEAYVVEGNLFVRDITSGKETKLSSDGSPTAYYSCYMYWSPDSKKIVTTRHYPVDFRQLTLIQSTPSFQFQPYVYTMDYIKPGDALPMDYPVLFDLEKGTQYNIEFEDAEKQYSVGDIEWKKDSKSFTFQYNQRGHQKYIVYKVDVAEALAKELIVEQEKTFIHYSKGYYKLLDERNEALWISERDGWRHLYLYDYNTCSVKRQLTKGEWVVNHVAAVNEKDSEVVLAVKGYTKGIDPYLTQYLLVNLDNGTQTLLTPEEGSHIATFSKDYKYMIDTYSKVNLAPQTVLRDAKTSKVLMTVSKADVSKMLKAGYVEPEPFVAKGRDGVTDIWGVIIRPRNFDKKKSYPVVEYIYAGPHNSFVPKTYKPLEIATLTELGFIVVQIDGMGTFNRSKAFHDVTWRNLKDSGYPDRIAWLKAANEKYPYMDLSKMAVYGFSSGGQSVMSALLLYGDFYKVGYASCGCYDNRMDKIWWNEQWLGYPIGDWYAENAAITHVNNLQGKLMLVHGEYDDNVDPSSTLQLVDALTKAGKEFDFVFLTNMRHTDGGKFGERKRRDFFVKNIMGVQTPDWNNLK